MFGKTHNAVGKNEFHHRESQTPRKAAYIPESKIKDYSNLKKWLCKIIMQPFDEQMVAH